MASYEARFRELLFKRGLSQTDLAKKIGKSKQAVSTWSRGTLPRDEETLIRLCETLGTTPAFLRYGGVEPDGPKESQTQGTVMLTLLSDQADTIRPAIEVMQVSVAWIRSHIPSAPLDRLRLHLVRGDSMVPTAAPGDLLIVDTSVSEYDSDDLYLLKNSQGLLTFKRLQAAPDGYNILSDNAKYPPLKVTSLATASYVIVGKVKMVGHFFVP